jgi:hypothetical protein
MRARGKWSLLLVAGSLFILSLQLPAAKIAIGPDWPGSFLFSFGWIGLFFFMPAWLANPAWMLAAVLIGMNWRGSVWLLMLGWLLAATAIPGFDTKGANQASGVAHVTIGFWVWMLSPLPLLLADRLRAPRTVAAIA